MRTASRPSTKRRSIRALDTHESFGTVLIEATAKALPIVATYITAVRNVVRQGVNGRLVAPDADDMSEGIRGLLQNPEVYRTCSAAGVAAVELYSWDAIIDATTAAYEQARSTREGRQRPGFGYRNLS